VDKTNFKTDSETKNFITRTGKKIHVARNNFQLRTDVKTVPNHLVP